MNSIFTIHPYHDGGALVFDDPAAGLVKEALVGGTDLLLEIAARAADADPARFTLLFSDAPFPGAHAAIWLEKGELGYGDWYHVHIPEVVQGDGWLCPALLKYFPSAPAKIHFQIKPFERKTS